MRELWGNRTTTILTEQPALEPFTHIYWTNTYTFSKRRIYCGYTAEDLGRIHTQIYTLSQGFEGLGQKKSHTAVNHF